MLTPLSCFAHTNRTQLTEAIRDYTQVNEQSNNQVREISELTERLSSVQAENQKIKSEQRQSLDEKYAFVVCFYRVFGVLYTLRTFFFTLLTLKIFLQKWFLNFSVLRLFLFNMHSIYKNLCNYNFIGLQFPSVFTELQILKNSRD